MANILFGVMGDALGHVNRARVLAERMPGHRFLFVGGGRTLELERRGFRVLEVPMASTAYSGNRVHLPKTVLNGIRLFKDCGRTLGRLLRAVRDFDPALALTDYEFFTPLAAKKLGIPCVSVDHQHIMTECRTHPVQGQTLNRMLLLLPLRFMYSRPRRYLIPSFFPCPPKDPNRATVLPPLLSPLLKTFTPTRGTHVLVYQTSSTFRRLIPVLRELSSRVIVYGLGRRDHTGNLTFKGPSKEAFLEDLASCRYLVANGGHNAISEALYLGKPVLSFPIRGAYEQALNAFMVSRSGYGEYVPSASPHADLFTRFEAKTDRFRERLQDLNVYGTDEMVERIERIIDVLDGGHPKSPPLPVAGPGSPCRTERP